jgi:16S rRNA processing protein RimM
VSDPGPPRVAVGRVTRAHGLNGEVSVLVLSEIEDRFTPGAALLLEDGRTLTVEEVRRHRSRLLVKFTEIPDRTAAESLHHRYLFVNETDVPAPPEGAFWPHQLEGCEVVTEGGRSLGVIREIVQGPANDIWVTGPSETEVLVPALKDVVVSVDVEGRRVVVHEIPGLTTPE